MKKQNGFVLFIALLFIFIVTLIVMSDTQTMILDKKILNSVHHEFQVYTVAQWGIQSAVHALEGDPIVLPDSSIVLNTTVKNIKTDLCDNQTVEIQVIAQDQFSKVVLNSRDIFAKVPREKGCQKIPIHQRIGWQES